MATFFKKGGFQLDWRAAIIKSWAGMRGVVTLAAALALPTSLPGRDFILVTSFVVILVTVLIQGTSIGWLIALLKMKKDALGEHAYLTEPQCWALLEAAQFSAVEARAYDSDGKLLHPRLLEQYGYRARISDLHRNAPELPVDAHAAHYDIILAAIAAGREALLKLHRSRQLNDEMLHTLERDLDLQKIAAIHSRGD
ncbi:cation:proton antiporter [Undibacterium sp. Di26W]|uniref:cation:proton antiporter domain-containing protein n=1 Tax=Undibacterium sp. Di26W TaxID=3413035 RepID=UPI003BF2A335